MWLLQLGFFPHLIKFHGVHTQLRVISSASNYPRTLKKPSPASRFVTATRVIEVLCVHLWFVHQVPHFVQHILRALQLTVSEHNECLISANSSCIYNVHKKPHSISWFIIFFLLKLYLGTPISRKVQKERFTLTSFQDPCWREQRLCWKVCPFSRKISL